MPNRMSDEGLGTDAATAMVAMPAITPLATPDVFTTKVRTPVLVPIVMTRSEPPSAIPRSVPFS